MRIRWSPKEVIEAADRLETCVNKIVKPLEQARKAAEEARGIPNLPDYVKYRFNAFAFEVERAIGGVPHKSWDGSEQILSGTLRLKIAEIRKEVPKDALAEAMAKPELFKLPHVTKIKAGSNSLSKGGEIDTSRNEQAQEIAGEEE